MIGNFSVQQSTSWRHQSDLIADAVREIAYSRGKRLEILEAGCGQRWHIDLTGVDYRLTGVDLDAEALRLRLEVQKDLDVAIHGDLSSVDLGGQLYDVVYSAYVLEHIREADVVLCRMTEWVAPGGLLILRLPERHSVRGFVTRVSPHWIHVAYYRWILGNRHAGKPGYAPYPTFYHPSVSLRGIVEHARASGLEIIGCYGDGFRREGTGVMRRITWLAIQAIALLSFRRLTGKYSDLLYLIYKPAPSVRPLVQ